MQKSALKLKNEGKEKVRVEAQPGEPTEQERLEHEATHIPFAHWCESCVEAKSKQDHEKKNPEAGKDFGRSPLSHCTVGLYVLARKGHTCTGCNMFMDSNVSGYFCVRKANREKDSGESLEVGAQYWTSG